MQQANRLQKIRKAMALTQENIAYKCGISDSAYVQIERKVINSTHKTLCKIADALGVSVFVRR